MKRDVFFLAVLLGGVGTLTSSLSLPRAGTRAGPGVAPSARAVAPPASLAIDQTLRAGWRAEGLEHAPRATDLAVIRRLALALTGAIPALEAIRRFEVRPPATRLAGWIDETLRERRTSDYLAERLARTVVGTEGGPFLVYRRRRLVAWLGDELHRNRPYDAIVRDLIADRGLWTDHPATNFVSVTYDETTKAYNPERLAARVTRAFLGLRLDCAQCHDHPFEPWKQADFQGLAAFFGQVQPSLAGISDGSGEFRPHTRAGAPGAAVEPRVPFLPELVPDSGSRRVRLARWITDPRNAQFARATANRAWALLFGRPLVDPIDDIARTGGGGTEGEGGMGSEADPGVSATILALLADDFARGGFDFRRLLRTIAMTEAFALDSAAATDCEAEPTTPLEAAWAAFPITRLRPEQIAGATIQTATTATIDGDSHILRRLATFGGINDFVQRHGDPGENEFDAEGAGTVPQRLLLMNGDLVQQQIRGDFAHVAGQITTLAPDDRVAVEAAYLATLTRRPTPAEAAHFRARLAGTTGDARKQAVTDLLWVLLNTTEFSYNH